MKFLSQARQGREEVIMKCDKCNGTGIDKKDPQSACRICGGRGHYQKSKINKPTTKKTEFRDCITVGRFIQHLQKLPKDMLVGRVGHFGEINEIDKGDIQVVEGYRVPKNKTWREVLQKELKIKLLEIYVPDIGPEPD